MAESERSPSSRESAADTWIPTASAIFVISVASLFLEMLLIRWIGTEVRIFAYLQNSILIACFLGLGLGSLTSRRHIALKQTLIPLVVLLTCLAIPFMRRGLGQTTELLGILNDFVFWGMVTSPDSSSTIIALVLGLGITFGILIFTVDMFVPLGRLVGRLIDTYPNTIWAYTMNVAGSLAGIWLFVALSWFYQPPAVWIAVLAILLLPFIWSRPHLRGTNVLLLLVVGLSVPAGRSSEAVEVAWSPYQKLTLVKGVNNGNGASAMPDYYTMKVNNVFFQNLVDLSNVAIGRTYRRQSESNGLTQFDFPLLLHPHVQKYLVVGSGTGNDIAAALRHGVREITAVEIDPAIISFGRKYHPEHPYDSASVRIVNDDARSFFTRTQEKFDVIAFGLLDSHTTTAMTNARLDSYVYTVESIDRAKELLADGGVLVVNFAAQRHFIVDRIAGTLRHVFGKEPIVFGTPDSINWSGIVFVSGNLPMARDQIALNPELQALVTGMQKSHPISLSYETNLTTDDWPYLYLEKPRIPVIYYLLAGLIVLVTIRSYYAWNAAGILAQWHLSHWHFFFLGAAFLLLEVQNISKASALLGNTWHVNAVIISGMLVMVLIANVLQLFYPRIPIGCVYFVLIATSVALYLLDFGRFASMPYFTRAVVVGSLTTLPVAFSGILFIRSFAATKRKDEALGANLFGGLTGGLLQTLTFVTGIKALLLVVAALYGCSILTRGRQSSLR
jgi:hypothetical protein